MSDGCTPVHHWLAATALPVQFSIFRRRYRARIKLVSLCTLIKQLSGDAHANHNIDAAIFNYKNWYEIKIVQVSLDLCSSDRGAYNTDLWYFLQYLEGTTLE